MAALAATRGADRRGGSVEVPGRALGGDASINRP